MKHSSIFLVILFLFTNSLLSKDLVGNGLLTTEKRDLTLFKELSVEGPFKVHLIYDENYSFQISGDSNIVQLVQTQLKGDKLIVKLERDIAPKNDLQVEIKMPILTSLEEKGNVHVSMDKFNLKLVAFHSDGLNSLQGNSKFDSVSIHMQGNGSFDLSKMQLKKIDVLANGNGNIKLHEAKDASGELVGNVEFYYKNISHSNTIKAKGHSRLIKL